MLLDPMLPTLGDEPFSDDGYIFEPKIDGQRLFIRIRQGVARLCTRYGVDVTRQYPELCRVPVADGADAILDGVAAFFDDTAGAFSSDALRERLRLKKDLDIRLASVRCPVHFFAFDILEKDGEDVRGIPLQERKRLLERTLDDNLCYHRMFALEAQGKKLFDAINSEGLEGMVAKRLNSSYAGGRGSNWLAIRKYRYANVRIAGYRKQGFGWLLERDGRRVGVMDAGVPGSSRQAFQAVSHLIETGEDRSFVYVRPVIEARIRYLHRTGCGEVRDPEFVQFVGEEGPLCDRTQLNAG